MDTETLTATVTAIKDDPQPLRLPLSCPHHLLSGTHNRSVVTVFFGARQEDRPCPGLCHGRGRAGDPGRPRPGRESRRTPLHALASCLTTSLVAHAAVRGIEIEELESALEGDIDLRGFLGLDATVPRGYTAIRAAFRARGTAENVARLRELAEFSPVFNTLSQGTRVEVTVERAARSRDPTPAGEDLLLIAFAALEAVDVPFSRRGLPSRPPPSRHACGDTMALPHVCDAQPSFPDQRRLPCNPSSGLPPNPSLDRVNLTPGIRLEHRLRPPASSPASLESAWAAEPLSVWT